MLNSFGEYKTKHKFGKFGTGRAPTSAYKFKNKIMKKRKISKFHGSIEKAITLP